MLLKARHLRNVRHHIRKLPQYVGGSIRFKKHIRQFVTVPRVVVVGAAGGGLDKWRPWAELRLVQGTGFEPAQAECQRLQRAFPFAEFHPVALGNRTGPADLHLTSGPDCTSCLEPDMAVLAPYSAAQYFQVKETVKVELRRFDELCREGAVRAPHFLQVDVQGFEYEVLEGWGGCLDELVGIELESHFMSIYKEQKSLWQLIEYLKERGFALRHLEPQGPFGGELVEVNVFFSRLLRPEESEKRSLVKLWEWVCGVPHFDGTREGLG